MTPGPGGINFEPVIRQEIEDLKLRLYRLDQAREKIKSRIAYLEGELKEE